MLTSMFMKVVYSDGFDMYVLHSCNHSEPGNTNLIASKHACKKQKIHSTVV
jgi:hypothetical protein